jgi:hypothetical protein
MKKRLIILIGLFLVGGCSMREDIEARQILEYKTLSFQCLSFCNDNYKFEDCKKICYDTKE